MMENEKAKPPGPDHPQEQNSEQKDHEKADDKAERDPETGELKWKEDIKKQTGGG